MAKKFTPPTAGFQGLEEFFPMIGPACPAVALAKAEARRATAGGIPDVLLVSPKEATQQERQQFFPMIGKTNLTAQSHWGS